MKLSVISEYQYLARKRREISVISGMKMALAARIASKASVADAIAYQYQ
jgi:hypothetical protein